MPGPDNLGHTVRCRTDYISYASPLFPRVSRAALQPVMFATAAASGACHSAPQVGSPLLIASGLVVTFDDLARERDYRA